MEISKRIQKECEILLKKYPTLAVRNIKSNTLCIAGLMPIIDENRYLWGEYQIEIQIMSSYPNDLPILIEIGGAIKRDEDLHINRNGLCCVGTTAHQYRLLKSEITITRWVELLAIPYLANQIYYNETGVYLNGDLSHREPGLFEDYSLFFELSSPREVVEHLKYLLELKSLSQNAKCFCGSGRKYKRCFLENKVSHLFHIPRKVLEKDLKTLKFYYGIS